MAYEDWEEVKPPAARPSEAERKAIARRAKKRRAEELARLTADWLKTPEGRADQRAADQERAVKDAAAADWGRLPGWARPMVTPRASVTFKRSTELIDGKAAVYGPGSDFSFFADVFNLQASRHSIFTPRHGADDPATITDRLWAHQKQMAHLATRTEEGRALYQRYFQERNRRTWGTPSDRSREDFRGMWDPSVWSPSTRAVSTLTGSMGDFAPPMFVLKDFDIYRTAASPVAAQATQRDLPVTGMTVNVPVLTGPVEMAVQETENDDIAASSPTATYAEAPVLTLAGAVQISQQTLDRFGPGASADQVITEQAARQAGTTLDSQCITAVLANAGNITNAADPSIAALFADVGQAAATIAGTEGTRLSATHTFIPPALSKWFQAQVDSEGHPIWTPSPAAMLGRAGEVNTRSEGYTGYDLLGAQAFEDANLPATDSGADGTVLVGDVPTGLAVYTAPPVVDVWPEFDPLAMTAVITIRSYAALTVRYPAAFVQITGSAYPAAPTFTGS